MDNQQILPDQNSMVNEGPSQQAVSNNSRLFLVVAISVLLAAVLAGSAVYFWQKSVNKETVNALEQKISSLEEQVSGMKEVKIPTQPTTESAVNLKTYTNEKYGFGIKYSPELELNIKEQQRENSSAIVSLYITNDNNLNLFYDKPENSIKDIYFSLTIEMFKDMDKEKIISEWFDTICNSPWKTDPVSCKQEKINAFKSYNQNDIQGYTADIIPYEQSFTYLIINHDPYILFTVLGGPEGTFPTNNAINLRDQILTTFKFTDTSTVDSNTKLLEPSLVPMTNWRTVSFKQNIIISQGGESRPGHVELKIPSSWTTKTIQVGTGEGIGGAICNDFQIASGDGSTQLVIKPGCGDTNNEYLPISGQVQKVELITNKGNDGHDSYTVRYYDSSTNTYHYGSIGVSPGASIDIQKDQIYPNLVLQYEPDRPEQWLWTSYDLTYRGDAGNQKTALNTVDTIISTLKLTD